MSKKPAPFYNKQPSKPHMVAHHEEVVTRFQGPLPPPELLKQFEEAHPGAAERIISMTEKEQSHRHSIVGIAVKGDIFISALGQFFAFCLGAMGIIGAVFLLYKGKKLEGFGVIVTSLATLAGAFIYRKQEKRHQDQGQATDNKSKAVSEVGE